MPARRKRCSGKKQQAPKEASDVGLATTSEATAKATPRLLEHCEVMLAIESLYADELKPFGRILRKRVAERLAVKDAIAWVPGCEENLPIVDITDLLALCEGSERVNVEPEEGGDWSALLVDRPRSFVDVYCPDDRYPATMWEAFEQYLAQDDDESLPGGRYSCAQVLESRDLPFLQGRSLGDVCHVVQLAISKKKLLGYLNGAIVPYRSSQSMIKEQCAKRAQPCAIPTQSSGDKQLAMADLETARHCMRALLDNAAALANDGSVGTVPLSNVKRFLRSKFNVELSETSLGHSKLSDLLQDSKFSDICTVRLQKHGYIVVQVRPDVPVGNEPRGLELRSNEDLRICGFDEPLSLDLDELASSPQGSRTFLSSSLLTEKNFVGGLVKRTFIHASLPPQTPLNTQRRSQSVPKDYGYQRHAFETGFDFSHRSDSTDSTVDSVSELGMESSFVSADIATLSSPSPFVRRRYVTNQSPGRNYDNSAAIKSYDHSHFDFRDMLPECPFVADGSNGYFTRTEFCEPTFSSSRGYYPDALPGIQQARLQSPERRKQRFLSPPTIDREGSIGSIGLSRIQNTFIHSPKPPPTPLQPGSSRRARSLPKDVGSDKNHWEATCQALGFAYVEENLHSDFESSLGCEWGPTPNVYSNPKGLYSLASSPAYVVNSPTLTASPMHSHLRSSNSQKILLRLATGPCPLIEQTCTKPPLEHRVIRLADLVE